MVDLIAEHIDVRLPFLVKLKMMLHIGMCPDCRNYRDQIRTAERFLRHYFSKQGMPSDSELSEEDISAIERRLLDEIPPEGNS
jgi:predicted anti-sigma-YlaC factor YlaD